MKLLCPICKEALETKGKSAVCSNGHCYDYHKSGYLNLLLKQSKDHGDNKQLVNARTRFLNTGAYAFLKDTLVEIAKAQKDSDNCNFVDLGCGEGYYTKDIPASSKIGFDLSKEALKTAAKEDHDSQYVISSIFNLPLGDESSDLIMTCFAPFAKEEVERILKEEGIFVFVTPGPKHLYELKEILYETPYLNKIEDLDTSLTLCDTIKIEQQIDLDQEALMNLFEMTPYAYKTGQEGIDRLTKIDHLSITAQFIIRIYTKE